MTQDERGTSAADPLAHWDIRDEHAASYIHARLSQLAMRRAGVELEDEQNVLLDNWISGLREAGAVVDYRPETREGFFLVYAREGIDTDVVRRADR
ncbi:hypothetical protein [Brachybacterium phenoliresistens]|uniref:hypothetical protein n=1 Tax=Brachybacterium phenoliresistens TaxID=396014 RepID=UPI0031DC0DD1